MSEIKKFEFFSKKVLTIRDRSGKMCKSQVRATKQRTLKIEQRLEKGTRKLRV